MKIIILGGGAMGSLLGSFLITGDNDITILCRSHEHANEINRKGLIIEALSREKIYKIRTSTDPCSIGYADLILVMVKTYDTSNAIRTILKNIKPETMVLTLQNGIGNWEKIASIVGQEKVLAGVTAQGATFIEPGRIRHGGVGPTHIGELNQKISKRLEKLVLLFNSAGLETYASDNIEKILWQKLVINVGINAITALTGILNGKIASVPEASAISLAAVSEAVDVAMALGIKLEHDQGKKCLKVAEATQNNRSSMGQDVDRHRKTEIDAINGAIIKLGNDMGIQTPVNQTLYQLIKTVENNF
uniref:2-dehydropantoate 2-reductase n=1 Tax=uncultured delta proteobacterium TaxID=34034 RepID=Q2YZS9_9DELT|nr:ketopantoate reductase [uncultured delta proteobacterium]